MYQNYTGAIKSQPISFSSFIYKNHYVESECIDWLYFVRYGFTLPVDSSKIGSITMTIGTVDPDAMDESYDADATSNMTATCDEEGAVDALINGLETGDMTYAYCGGRSWRSFFCDQRPTICVDCAQNECNVCPGTPHRLFMKPCADACNENLAAFSVLSFGIIRNILFPVPDESTRMISGITSSSVVVSFNVSRPGTIFCNAQQRTFQSIVAIKKSPFYAIVQYTDDDEVSANPLIATIQIENLLPETFYYLYCYTEDFDDHFMEISDVLQYQTNFTTACCRSLSIESDMSSIAQYNPSDPSTIDPVLFNLLLSSSLSSDCTVVLNSSASDTDFLPSSEYTFNAASADLLRTFEIKAPSAEDIIISANAIDCDDTVRNTAISIEVRGFGSPPSGPSLISVQYSDVGTSLKLLFDSSTDRMGMSSRFRCDLLLAFYGASGSYCHWLSDTMLTADLGDSSLSELSVGSVIGLHGSKMYAKCQYPQVPIACNLYTDMNVAQNLSLQAPENPVTPTIILSLPAAEVFICDGIKIDPTASSGNGGKEWAKVLWSLSGQYMSGTFPVDIDTSSLELYLNSRYNTTDSLVLVPTQDEDGNVLVRTGTYHITLNVQNAFGRPDQSTKTVTVIEAQDIPTISIVGSSVVDSFRNKELSLFASASVLVCGVPMDSGLDYTWTIYLKGEQLMRNIISSSKDVRQFRFEKYILDANSFYVAKVVASLVDDPTVVSQPAIATIQLGLAGIIASIAGGSSRTVISTDPFSLDASGSYDLDYPEDTSGLSFKWSCIERSPSYGRLCYKNEEMTELLELSDEAINEIEAAEFTRAAAFEFVVTVSNAYGLTDMTSTLITVVKDAVPTVVIDPILTKVNSNSRIIVTGKVIVPENQTAVTVWSCDSMENETLLSYSLVPSLSRSFSTGTFGNIRLVLSPNKLLSGATYTFRLLASRVGFEETENSVSSVKVLMNAPPSGGKVTIYPELGEAMKTYFTIGTLRWTDDVEDLPLSFSMAYYTDDETAMTTIKALNMNTQVNTTLGQGIERMGFAVTCVTFAFDILGDSSSTTKQTIVRPVKVNVDELNTLMVEKVKTAMKSGDSEAVGTVLSQTMSFINSANCSFAPNCTSLFREECTIMKDTCGKCFSGYAGVSGESNIPCQEMKYSSRRRLSQQLSFTDIDVLHLLTDTENKECPLDCSGNGVCLFFNGRDEQIQECALTTFSCRAQCECSTGWAGIDCATQASNLTSVRAIKDSICSSFNNIPAQDITTSLITERANSVRDALLDPTLLSNEGFMNCTLFFLGSIEPMNGDEEYYELASVVSSEVYSTLSTILNGDMYGKLPEETVLRIISMIKTLALYREKYIVAGQEDDPFIDSNGNDNFRVLIKRERYRDLRGLIVDGTTSQLEDLSASNMKYVETSIMTSDAISSSNSESEIGMGVVQYARNFMRVPTDVANYSFVEV